MTDDSRRADLTDDAFERRAREAAAALRSPAPPGGVTRIETAARRRRTTRLAVGVATPCVLLIAGVVFAVRNSAEPAEQDIVDTGRTTLTTSVVATASTTTATTTPASTTTTAAGTPTTSRLALPAVQNVEASGGRTVVSLTRPYNPIVVGDQVWTTAEKDPITRRDRNTGATLGTIPYVAGPPEKVGKPVVAFGSVWLPAAAADGSIWRLDPATGEVLARIPIPGGLFSDATSFASDLGSSDEGIWALSAAADRQLVRIDPMTNAVAAVFPAGRFASFVSYGHGSLWLTRLDGTLSRIDPSDGREIAKLTLSVARGIAISDSSAVWIYGDAAGRFRLVKVDPATNTILFDIGVSDVEVRGPWDVVAGGGAIWVTAVDALAIKIDPATGTVLARYGPGIGVGTLALDGDDLWIAAYWENKLIRLPFRS